MKIATIYITNLNVPTIIGTNDWERKKQQNILLNISISYNATKAITHDDLHCALDYDALSQEIIQKAAKSKFFLLETFTAMVVGLIIEKPLVRTVTVRATKPHALKSSESVSVELSEKRK
jgi:D-erythro-7,8-dihydroneopterin triphosphate epimerase